MHLKRIKIEGKKKKRTDFLSAEEEGVKGVAGAALDEGATKGFAKKARQRTFSSAAILAKMGLLESVWRDK